MDKEIFKLIATKEDLKNLVSKEEFAEFKERSLTRLDEIMTILKRLDEKRLFTFEMVKRIEGQVEEQRKEINEIKEVLKIR